MTNEMTKNVNGGTLSTAERLPETRQFLPTIDVLEDAEKYTIWCDVPGVDPAKVDVRYEQGRLQIWAPAAPRQEENTRYLLREYAVGDYLRSFNLSETVDASAIEAECADGVLRLTFPKVQSARPRKIDVRAK